MMLALVLAAAPAVWVVGVDGLDGAKVLPHFEGSAKRVDGSAVYSYLLGRRDSVLDFQDFGGFAAEPVAGWPAGLGQVWKDGLSHCRGLAGPPPWRDTMPQALFCAKRLSRFLWQRYVHSLKADRVFELDVGEERTLSRVEGRTWQPGMTQQTRVVERVPKAEEPAAVKQVAGELVAGRGETAALEVIDALASNRLSDPWSNQKPVGSVKLKKSCPELPKKLEVKSPGPVAESLTRGWAPEGATGAALTCTLGFNQHDEGPMRIYNAELTCGALTVATETADVALKPVELTATKLADALAARLCK